MPVTLQNYQAFLQDIRNRKARIQQDSNLSAQGKNAQLIALGKEVKDAISQLKVDATGKTSEQQKQLGEMKRPGRFIPKLEDRQLQEYLGDMLLSSLAVNGKDGDRLIDAVQGFINEGTDRQTTFIRYYHKVSEVAKDVGEVVAARLQTTYHKVSAELATPEQQSFDKKRSELMSEVMKVNGSLSVATDLLQREVVEESPWNQTREI